MAAPKPEVKPPAVVAAVKAPRKKPVRKSPALKDYPNRLAWLKAMTDYEESQSEVGTQAKIVRLDKRIAAKAKAIADLQAEVAALETERHLLVPVGLAQAEPDEQAQADQP